MKKLIISTVAALLLLTALTSIVFATPAVADKQLPLRGSLHAVENDVVDWPTIYVHGSGSGNATVLGKYTVHYDGIVHNDAAGVGTGTLAAHLVAANGDSLFAEVNGVGRPTATPGINKIVEVYTITGGTGRFAGASGSFTDERLINLGTGVTWGTFEGYIEIPK
jgi:hypothetical protein